MRLFVYEYATAVGPGVPASIRAEGWAMLSALVEDFVHVSDVEVTTLLHEDLSASPGHHCVHVTTDNERAVFREQTRRTDRTLVIAPETGGILAQRSRWVLEAGGTLLGSSPEVIEQTTDKLKLSEHFLHQGIPTPKSALCNRAEIPTESFPVILKPRDGAGSQATFLVRSTAELRSCLEDAQRELPGAEFIVQPFVTGLAASVAVLVGPSSVVPLMPCLQHLSTDGRFRYLGGELPLRPDLARRASELGCRAVRAVPGLHGYVGVDLVLGEAEGSGDQVIEINPRLTTSYIGLRRLARFSIADLILQVSAGKRVSELKWNEETIRFAISGC